MRQSDFPDPPRAKQHKKVFTEFETQRIDPYYWLKDKSNPDVLAYLKEENHYTETVMSETAELQRTLYNEMLGRIREDDESCPVYANGYWYYTRTAIGKQYRTHWRKKDANSTEELLFDENNMAEGTSAFIFEDYAVSPDNRFALYLYNETGSFAEFTLKIRDLHTGKDIPASVEGVASVAWANDSNTFFYSLIDHSLRSSKIYRTRREVFGQAATLVYEEPDIRFSVYVSDEKTFQYIFISSVSTTTSEERFVSANFPCNPFTVFLPRIQDVDYSVCPHDTGFFVRYKDKQHLNGMVYTVPPDKYNDRCAWKEFIPHNTAVRIEGLDVLQNHLVAELRSNGLISFKIITLSTGVAFDIPFDEPVYKVSLDGNPEYRSNTIRYVYESLNCPRTVYELNLTTQKSNILKQQIIPSGFNRENYTVERIWADAPDGTRIPVALVYKKGLAKDGSAPAFIYGYGSYGISCEAYFNSSIFSLIDRGFVYAKAQIRGGADLGEQWYEDGKLLKKMNTFTDFIVCCEYLIKNGYTATDRLAAMGGSAGGLLMGVVCNMRPDLFRAVIAAVPFVDIVTTMQDDSLPLTGGEYEEWGNPKDKMYYHYMLAYSPYDNITPQEYPHILVTAGLNDSQVLFHEPAKYTAKLRAYKKGNRIVLLRTDMTSGHGGATGRYGKLHDIAFEYAFILHMLAHTL